MSDMDERALKRWLAKVSYAENGCWPWTGATSRGYGQMLFEGKVRQAHILGYEHHVGPVPDGLELDHTCHNNDTGCPGGKICLHRRCANPAHLEPVTHGINNARSRSLTAQNMTKSKCPQGHSYEGANLYVDKTGRRHCKECRRANVRRHYAKSDGAGYMRAWRAERKAARETDRA